MSQTNTTPKDIMPPDEMVETSRMPASVTAKIGECFFVSADSFKRGNGEVWIVLAAGNYETAPITRSRL